MTYRRYAVYPLPLNDATSPSSSRPLLGTEFTHDLGHRLSDGYVRVVHFLSLACLMLAL